MLTLFSANGAWTHLYADGELIREGGTSMSAPLVASIINLVRHARPRGAKTTC
jgi:xanthine dehydrogenase molybdopterin-binding subunit B